MPKWNGGVIGVANNPTISSAKGIWSLSEATKAIRAGLWPPSNAGADPYFENVTMLLSGNGTNGAQNNTFLDSSTNNFTITRNGNTTQGTFTPFSKPDGRWSNYFDGTGDYLTSSGNSNSAVGSGDFCIECFVYYASYPAQYTTLFGTRTSTATSTTAFSIGVENNGSMLAFSDVFIAQTASSVFSLNTWNHVVFSRSGTTARLFLNGVLRATGTNSQNFSTQAFSIGALGNGAETIAGYISNVRLVKGSVPTTYQTSSTTVGTSIFTVPTIPLTDSSQGATSGDVEILTCQSNRFIDNSTNAFAITRNGDVSIQTFSPFPTLTAYASGTNGGSGYFDGSGDYLTVADNAAFEFGSGDFTIELWVNTTSSSQYDGLVTKESGAVGGAWSLMINSSSSTAGDVAFWSYDYNSFSGAMVITTGASIRDGGWHHIALVRNGSSWAIYIDGVSRGTQTSSATLGNSSADVWIGNTQSTPTRDFPGYMSGLRIVKGTAVYTAAFTPPTAPLTAITNTSLLCNFTNGGIIDAAMSNDLETVGGAQISTTQSKFGGSSMYFDGNGDYLVSRANSGLALGSGDFTTEMWLYPTAFASYVSVWSCTNSVSVATGFHIGFDSSGQLFVYQNSAFRLGPSSTSGTLTLNQWNHVALVRYSGVVKFYVNGVAASTTWSTTQDFSQGFILIGANPAGGSEYYTGYIDDLRITKGYARYTANFTAPVGPFVGFGD